MSAREGSRWLLPGKSKTNGKLPATRETTAATAVLPAPLAAQSFQAASQ